MQNKYTNVAKVRRATVIIVYTNRIEIKYVYNEYDRILRFCIRTFVLVYNLVKNTHEM